MSPERSCECVWGIKHSLSIRLLLRITFAHIMGRSALVVLTLAAFTRLAYGVSSQSYTWKNVKIGGGGGFVPGIVFNPSQKGLAYARTDIGGAYKLNSDDTWTPLLDFVDDARWNYWGVDALATDPVDPKRLYLVSQLLSDWISILSLASRLLECTQTAGTPTMGKF